MERGAADASSCSAPIGAVRCRRRALQNSAFGAPSAFATSRAAADGSVQEALAAPSRSWDGFRLLASRTDDCEVAERIAARR